MPVKRKPCAALDNVRSIFHHHGMDIETRVSAVEADLSSVKAELAVIRSNYATKADWEELRTGLKSDMHDLRTELKSEMHDLRLELKAEIHGLRVDVQAIRVEFQKELHAQTWKMYGFAVFLLGALHLLNRYGY